MPDNDNIPSFISFEPEEEYDGKSNQFTGSHRLGNFVKAETLFDRIQRGLVEEDDHEAWLLGRAIHCLVLEGRKEFNRRYAVGGPINPQTGKPYKSNSQAFQNWAAAQGKPVLSHSQFERVQKVADGVACHAGACSILASSVAEGVVRTDYCGIAWEKFMKTAWNAFSDWKHARDTAKSAIQEMARAVEKAAKHEKDIALLLRRHGPITHDNHVYFLSDGMVACEPCSDSFNVKMEEVK